MSFEEVMERVRERLLAEQREQGQMARLKIRNRTHHQAQQSRIEDGGVLIRGAMEPN